MSERDLALSYTYSKARYLRAGKSRKAENMRNNEGTLLPIAMLTMRPYYLETSRWSGATLRTPP